jgi:RNA polymerase sigma-70 factor (ECF subfamily)
VSTIGSPPRRRPDVAPDEAPERWSEPPDLHALYRMYARYVAWFATRLLGHDEEVADVVHDVFIQAERSLRDRREPLAVKRWLATTTVRSSTHRLRLRRLRFALGLRRDVRHESMIASDSTPEEQAACAELYRALDRLPAQERVAWGLRYLQDEPLESVAALCGCSLATAKRRIAAAQARIRKELRP